QVGTLSKAIGALGGYVCGSRDLIDFLYHRARPFLFSTSHPPSVAATCIAAFEVLEQEPERIEKLWENTRYFKKELGSLGFNIGGQTTPASETPITPIIVGDGARAMEFSRELFKEGVMATGIRIHFSGIGRERIPERVRAVLGDDRGEGLHRGPGLPDESIGLEARDQERVASERLVPDRIEAVLDDPFQGQD